MTKPRPRPPRLPTALREVLDDRGRAALGAFYGMRERVGALTQYVSTVLLGFRVIRRLGAKGTRPKTKARSAVDYLERQKLAGHQDLLHTVVVFLWGLLEAGVEDMTTAWLANTEPSRFGGAVQKLRLRAADLMTRDRSGQAALLIEALKGELRHEHAGVDLFDALFREVGISGYATTPQLRRVLIEIHQSRNVVLHKAGIVDERFCRVCGWRRQTPGSPLRLTADDVDTYSRAVWYYVETLGNAILVQSIPDHRGSARRAGRLERRIRANQPT